MITFRNDEWVADFIFARICQHDVEMDYRYFFYSWFSRNTRKAWIKGFKTYEAAKSDAESRIKGFDASLILNGEHL